MKIDFGQRLKNYSGGPIRINDVEMTLAVAAVDALVSLQDDPASTPSDHLARHALAQAIHAADGEFDVSIDNLKIIQDRIARRWTTLIAAPALLALEGK